MVNFIAESIFCVILPEHSDTVEYGDIQYRKTLSNSVSIQFTCQHFADVYSFVFYILACLLQMCIILLACCMQMCMLLACLHFFADVLSVECRMP